MLTYREKIKAPGKEEGFEYALRLLAMYPLEYVPVQALQSSSEAELDAIKTY